MPPFPGSEELRRRPGPLTSKADIAAFLELVCGMRGCEKARRALDYVLEDSASPTETVSAMLLSLPYRLGASGCLRRSLTSALTSMIRRGRSPVMGFIASISIGGRQGSASSTTAGRSMRANSRSRRTGCAKTPSRQWGSTRYRLLPNVCVMIRCSRPSTLRRPPDRV